MGGKLENEIYMKIYVRKKERQITWIIEQEMSNYDNG